MKLIVGVSAVLMMSTICAQSLTAAVPASVAEGSYECWGNAPRLAPRLMLNFKVTGKDRYTDPDGKGRSKLTILATVATSSAWKPFRWFPFFNIPSKSALIVP